MGVDLVLARGLNVDLVRASSLVLAREHRKRSAAAELARGEKAAIVRVSAILAVGARGLGLDLTLARCQGDDLAPGVALALARGMGVDLVLARGLNDDLVRARNPGVDLVLARGARDQAAAVDALKERGAV